MYALPLVLPLSLAPNRPPSPLCFAGAGRWNHPPASRSPALSRSLPATHPATHPSLTMCKLSPRRRWRCWRPARRTRDATPTRVFWRASLRCAMNQRCTKLRIVNARDWHVGTEKWFLERLTDPKLSRRATCMLRTGYNRVEGNRRASRNGLVSDLPPGIPTVTIRRLLHRCIRCALPLSSLRVSHRSRGEKGRGCEGCTVSGCEVYSGLGEVPRAFCWGPPSSQSPPDDDRDRDASGAPQDSPGESRVDSTALGGFGSRTHAEAGTAG
jgi:hypothetical protein